MKVDLLNGDSYFVKVMIYNKMYTHDKSWFGSYLISSLSHELCNKCADELSKL